MPTNKQRRETARRHLERQLQRRQEREARRRRVTLIASVVGTLVLIGVVVIAVIAFSGNDNTKKTKIAAGRTNTSTTSTSTTPTPTPTPSTSYAPAKGPAVSFKGVTVKGATDLKGYPVVTSKSSTDPKGTVEVKDLVVGKGPVASPSSTVTVQYYGVLYKNGTYFDSSWKRGMPAVFPLTGVVKGFTYGIGGTKGVAPMHVGGRRIIIVPSALGYGASGQPPTIPANAPLVFIVDLTKVGT